VTDATRLAIHAPDGRKPIVFNWGVSSFFGWGLNGMNLALSLAASADFYPLVALPSPLADCILDPLRQARLESFMDASAALWNTLQTIPQQDVTIGAPLIQGLGRQLTASPGAGGRHLSGEPTLGMVFIEHATLDQDARQRANRMALIVAGSRWNEAVLRANDIVHTTTVLQGVDTALFHPAPKTGQLRDRFVIFSGGKLEFRKGQDLVLKAFRAFHQRHPEALLLTAWGNVWTWIEPDFATLTGTQPPHPLPNGEIDVPRWALDNDIPPEALIALHRTPNIAMPHVLREADVGLFPNRCEGGTNLVAMECMACGIPVILSANSGHMDLLEPGDTALALTRQNRVNLPNADVEGWGESDVEEIVERLEQVWQDRQAAQALGQRGAAMMSTLTWERQTDLLLRAIRPLLD